ncbi:MAG TPA: hypothetical protein VFT48_00230 [Pyrinomonadaceae bacterium]|nr:hypothetical protein [Pyrinomonadaceae bacterium]
MKLLLLSLTQHEALQHKVIHLGTHETAITVGRSANDPEAVSFASLNNNWQHGPESGDRRTLRKHQQHAHGDPLMN